MITDLDLDTYSQEEILKGIPVCWVIDGQCLYDLPLIKKYADMFFNCNNVIDISDQYPNNNGITVRLLKDDVILEDFNTSEYFGSILLSNPLVLDLNKYPYGKYVSSPNAEFDGEKFIILDQDVEGADAW